MQQALAGLFPTVQLSLGWAQFKTAFVPGQKCLPCWIDICKSQICRYASLQEAWELQVVVADCSHEVHDLMLTNINVYVYVQIFGYNRNNCSSDREIELHWCSGSQAGIGKRIVFDFVDVC
jgi:hypothetical protein